MNFVLSKKTVNVFADEFSTKIEIFKKPGSFQDCIEMFTENFEKNVLFYYFPKQQIFHLDIFINLKKIFWLKTETIPSQKRKKNRKTLFLVWLCLFFFYFIFYFYFFFLYYIYSPDSQESVGGAIERAPKISRYWSLVEILLKPPNRGKCPLQGHNE